MLTKEEKNWLKVCSVCLLLVVVSDSYSSFFQDHNQRCYDRISPFIKEDKRALAWLKREAQRDIGLAAGVAGVTIDWD